MLDKLYKVNPMTVSIVEDFIDITSIGEESLIDQAEDTMTILNKYIDTIEISGDKIQLQELLQDLHKDALTMDLE